VAVAEVAVSGLGGVGGPDGAAFGGEVVVVYLLAGDDEVFLLCGGADEEALIDECIIAGGFAGVGGVDLDGELDGVGPEAGGMSAVVGVDGTGEVDGIVGFFVAAGGECDGDAAEGGRAEGGADGRHVHVDLLFKMVGCRRGFFCLIWEWLPWVWNLIGVLGVETQIPSGMTARRGMGKGNNDNRNSNRRSPTGMTTRRATATATATTTATSNSRSPTG
jgi:hypothetical protein